MQVSISGGYRKHKNIILKQHPKAQTELNVIQKENTLWGFSNAKLKNAVSAVLFLNASHTIKKSSSFHLSKNIICLIVIDLVQVAQVSQTVEP